MTGAGRKGTGASAADGPERSAGEPSAGEPEPSEPSEPSEARAPFDLRRWLPVIGLVVAVWASLPRYTGPGAPRFVPDPSAEFANHVVPAIAVAIVSVWALAARRRAKGPGAVPFFAGLVVLLGGLFMFATHVPLVAQALRDESPWDATIYHTSSALAVFGLGLLWAVTHWSDLDAIDAANAQKAASKGSAKGSAKS